MPSVKLRTSGRRCKLDKPLGLIFKLIKKTNLNRQKQTIIYCLINNKREIKMKKELIKEDVLCGTFWINWREVPREEEILKEKRVFCLEIDGQKMYPSYIFDEDKIPLPVVVVIMLRLKNLTWIDLAYWFESKNKDIGFRRPRELIGGEPMTLLNSISELKLK